MRLPDAENHGGGGKTSVIKAINKHTNDSLFLATDGSVKDIMGKVLKFAPSSAKSYDVEAIQWEGERITGIRIVYYSLDKEGKWSLNRKTAIKFTGD